MPFESFLGHAKAVAAVREMLANARVPGALLFSGPDGVGKKTLALMFAKALICERPGPRRDDFCDECPRCRKAEAVLAAAREDLARRRAIKDSQKRTEGLMYFDLTLLEPLTRFILIEQIRQLRQVAYTRPFEFPQRVFIIDQAQAIHWQAADLLLKVLEEPPETTKLILICPNRFELRPTVRSRCVHIQFFPVEESIINTLLSAKRGMTKAGQALAARVVAGSVAAARGFDLEDFARRRRPWLDFLEGIAGKPAGSRLAFDWKTVFDSSRALTENREELEQTLKIGISLLRDLMLVLAGGPEAEVVNQDLLARLRAISDKLGFSGVQKLKEGIDDAYRLQTRNVNQQIGMDALAVDLVDRLNPADRHPTEAGR